jgi:hypothetical protein
MWSAELADEVTGGGDGDLMEMPRHGKHRKTKSRFPDFSTALGNRFRDSHIPTGPAAIHVSMPAEAEGSRSAERSLKVSWDLARLASAGL